MLFKGPFKFIYKGKHLPGFVVKVDTDATIKLDNSGNEPISIGNELLPSIGESIAMAIEEFSDNDSSR